MVRALLVALVSFVSAPLAVGQTGPLGCGELRNAIGPFDYRTAPQATRSLVEDHHFTPDVENLRRGISGAVGGELNYTLRAFPNHPRALLAMIKLGEKERTERPNGAGYTVACWFDRAVRFQPEDPTVRTLYGVYLLKKGAKQDAIKQLEQASTLAGEDANIHYNLGLAYFDVGDYPKSLRHAQEAYRLGFPLAGLRKKLEKAGKWRDASPVSEASPHAPGPGASTGSKSPPTRDNAQ